MITKNKSSLNLMALLKRVRAGVSKFTQLVKQAIKNPSTVKVFTPCYRIVEIFQEDDEYTVLMQVINKSVTFHAKPDKLLADDDFVNGLSPTDVRTLTYLGYLTINQPQYKILAQKLSAKDGDLFVVKKRGENKPILKTATEVNREVDMVSQMSAKDAKLVGYTLAMSDVVREKMEKVDTVKESQLSPMA